MRWALCLLLVLAACKAKERAHPHALPDQPGSATPAAPKSDDPWQRVEALAAPLGPSGASTQLERALPIAEINSDAWRDLEYKRPPPPLSQYPQGAEAVASLKVWSDAKGGLPAMSSPEKLGAVTMNLFAIGSTAIASAASREDLTPAIYLGTLLVTHGRNLLEVQMGASLLSHAQSKLADVDAKRESIPVPALDLVRVLAAQAGYSRATLATADETEAAAYKTFWLAALDGAERGEPARVTIERVRKAAEAAPSSIKDSVTRIAAVLEVLQTELEIAKKPSF